jgi:AsmA protein
MRKWIIAGASLVVLAGIVITILLNLNALLRRNRGYLIEQAEQALQRKISVGDVEATIFSGLGVRLENFAMSDDPAFSPDKFLHARDLQVNLKLWPLLRREVEVKRVILHEPVLRVIRNAQGSYNFSSIGESPNDHLARKNKTNDGRRAEADRLALLVGLIDISDGDIRYIDEKDGGDLRVTDLDLTVKDFSFEQPFSLRAAAALYAEKQNVEIAGRVGPVRGGDFREIPLDGTLDIDALDITRLQRALPSLKRALPKALGLSGIVRVDGLKFQGSLNHLSLSGAIEGSNTEWRFGNNFQKPGGIPFSLRAEASYSGDKLLIRKSVIKLHTVELAAAGEVPLGGNERLSLSFDAAPAPLQGWDKLIPALARYQVAGTVGARGKIQGRIGSGATPQIEGTLSFTDARLQPPDFPQPIENIDAQVRFHGQKADISAMTLTLGKSRIDLAAAIERFSPLTVAYKLSSTELYPADYKSGLTQDRVNDVMRNLKSDGTFTLDSGNLLYDGRLTSAGGILYNLPYKGLDTSLSVADKIAKVRSLRALLLDGSLQLTGQYLFNEPTPRFMATATAQGVALDQLYAFLNSKAERDILGRLSAEMKLVGSGKNWETIQPTLRGEGTAAVHEGALLNFNIAEGALNGMTGIPGLTNLFSPAVRKKYPETFAAKDTQFDELRGQFAIADGRLNINNLRIAAAEFTLQGSGWVDFARRVEFPATLYFSRPLSADLTRSAGELKYLLNKQAQLEIPLNVSGRLPHVKPRIDSKLLGGLAQRGFVQKGLEELQNQFLGERDSGGGAPRESKKKRHSAEDAIRRGLENLFRR